MEIEIDGHTEHDLADITLCKRVGEVLDQHYPGHPWLVGVNHRAGTVHIELPYQCRQTTRFPFGFLLHIASLNTVTGLVKKTVWAGGELLERYGLPRGPATLYSMLDAKANGLDRTNGIEKSRF